MLLPVSRHEGRIVLEKLAATVVQMSCRKDCVPASIMKSKTAIVKSCVEKILNNDLVLQTAKNTRNNSNKDTNNISSSSNNHSNNYSIDALVQKLGGICFSDFEKLL